MTHTEYEDRKNEILTSMQGYIDDDHIQKELRVEASKALDTLVLELIGKNKSVTGRMRPQGYPTYDLTESYHNQLRNNLRSIIKGKE
jgi:hypothetical protein